MSWPACPKCGKESKCIDSRPVEIGVRRRYKCRNDHRWTTIEQIAVKEATGVNEIVEAFGKRLTVSAWAKKLGMSTTGIINRLHVQKLPAEQALSAGAFEIKRQTKWKIGKP